MKKYLALCLTLLLLAALTACGPSSADTSPSPSAAGPGGADTSASPRPAETPEPEEEKADAAQVYGEVLDRFYELVSNGSGEAGEGEIGVLEATAGLERSEALERVGYAIRDVSGDGVPELLIGAVTQRQDSIGSGSEIYALYAIADGAPHFTFEGWARNSYYALGDGSFFNRGSNGALYSIFGIYALTPDGTALTCTDYYFTYEKDESFSKIGFYHNTSGAWDKAVSEELAVTEEEFRQIEEKLEGQIQSMELIPFSGYERTRAAAPVRAQWAEDALEGVSAYDSFAADASGSQSRVLFTAGSAVENFKVLALTLEDADEAGTMTFSTRELYAQDTLTPERPLSVEMTFYGAVPSYGISYVDESGTERSFAVEVSGEDGSLLLRETGGALVFKGGAAA